MKIPASGKSRLRAGSWLRGEEMRGSAPPTMVQVASWSHFGPLEPLQWTLSRPHVRVLRRYPFQATSSWVEFLPLAATHFESGDTAATMAYGPNWAKARALGDPYLRAPFSSGGRPSKFCSDFGRPASCSI